MGHAGIAMEDVCVWHAGIAMEDVCGAYWDIDERLRLTVLQICISNSCFVKGKAKDKCPKKTGSKTSYS